MIPSTVWTPTTALAGADTDLASLAEQAITASGDIVHATAKAEEHQRREHAADHITNFATTAATRLRSDSRWHPASASSGGRCSPSP